MLKLEDTTAQVETAVTSFLHAFDLLGRSARVDVRLPYQRARWKGVLDGTPRSAKRERFADPRIRLSVNLLGAPHSGARSFRPNGSRIRPPPSSVPRWPSHFPSASTTRTSS